MTSTNFEKLYKNLSIVKLTILSNIRKRKFLIFVVLFILTLTVFAAKNIGNNGENIRTFTISICGTFIGALSAFVLTIVREETTKKNNEISSLHYALFILGRQFNTLIILNKTCKQHKDKRELKRALELPANRLQDTSDLKFSYEDLSFLSGVDTVKVLHQLGIAQDCFYQTVEAHRHRNEYYVETIQPIIKEKEIHKQKLSEEQVKDMLGEVESEIIISNTNDIYIFIENTMRVLSETQMELIEAGKKIYPGIKLPKFSPAKEYL
ncbi:hypothetical protein [Janthinobacterium sp. SUN033]|uniref:hypothetical protein n=1 Tax=Janthinobacterium sp. SUN033 TaxID=3002439 RepID=UPI0025B135F8|nr:hypothetical protein [Janthinobacterium sp. SUN033]MDN2675628.1 hypothetical protein [Janthinobacterium sp. SUN033]